MIFEATSGEVYEFDRWYPVLVCASKHGVYTKLPDLKDARLYNLMSIKNVTPDKFWMVRSPNFEI